jgi:TolB-like protein/Tfp pilus assembly protein PilF
MSGPNNAVFLSYASQDAEAARRICEALRSGGVEVWFDIDGGLEHGDEWDAKIRRQIKECVLFIPIISANTQARHEGYFRIEWELAAQRALGIASGVAFILPVVIDDTREPDALVPDRFRTVQWTLLRGGEVTPEVKARYLKLWSHRTGVLKNNEMEPGRPRPGERDQGAASPARASVSRRLPMTVQIAAIVAVVFAVGVLIFQGRKAPTSLEAAIRGTPASGTVAAVNEVDQFVKQARDIIYEPDSGRADFALAENFLRRATDLAPASGAAWGASALLQHYFYSRAYDVDKQRLVHSQAEAEKTLRLDPDNTDALLALGLHRQLLGERERARDYLRRAGAADPQNSRVILALASQVRGLSARAKFMLDAATAVARPAEIYYDASLLYLNLRQLDEAARACDRAISAQPFWRTFVMRANIEKLQSADPARINAWLDRVPELKRDEPRVVLLRYNAAMLRRDHAAAVRVLSGVAVGFFEDNFFLGPKAYLLAPAYELAGQRERAAEQWQIAEHSIREKVLAEPQRTVWRPMLAVTLAARGRTTEAQSTADSCAADERVMSEVKSIEYTAEALVRLGRSAQAIELLQTAAGQHGWHFVSAATLAADPRWDPLRALPEYASLLAALKRAETDDPAPSLTSAAAPDQKSVAVLAFANLSDDKANEHFSDGISEELLNVLAKVPGLKVSARTSAFHFKGKDTPIPEIAQQLGVAYIVEGSVRKAGSTVRITALLINAADGFQVWGDTFTREAKDAFAVQDEIAGVIAQKFRLTLAAGQPAAVRTVNPDAMDLYLRGRQAWALRTRESLAQAEAFFLRAIALQPEIARAHAGLADAWLTLADLDGFARYQHRAAPEWNRIAAKLDEASAFDPGSAECFATQAQMASLRWKFADADRLFRRALELNPNYASAHQFFARYLALQGRMDEALVHIEAAVAADPFAPRIASNAAMIQVMAGRPAKALELAERGLALQSGNVQAAIWKCEALVAMGRVQELVEFVRAAPGADALRSRPMGATYLAQVGMPDQALRDSAVRGFETGNYVDTKRYNGTRANLVFGDKAGALASLDPNDATYASCEWMAYLPLFDQIRTEPAFRRYYETVGLSEAHARAQAWRAANPPQKVEAKR